MAQQINLYDPALRPQRDAFTAQASLLWALGAAVLAVAAAATLNMATTHKAALPTLAAGPAAPGDAASAPALPLSESATELQRLRDFETHQRRVQAAIQDGGLGARNGHAEYLRALARQAQPQVWLTGFSIKPETHALEIDGQTLDPSALPAYLRRLNSEERFKGRPFAHLHIRQPTAEGAAGTAVVATESSTPTYPQFTLRSLPAGKEAVR